MKKAFHDDEYEKLKESKLGVFIKLQELGFDWASRLVHYILGFQPGHKEETRVINIVQKDTGEMFPKWEFDVEDTPAENIIKLMFVKRPWKWTMDCWEVTGTWVNTKPADMSPAKKKKEDARYQEKRDAALAFCRAKSDRTRKLAASQQSPYTANSTAKVIIPNKKLYPGYNPFAPIDKRKLKELANWLKTCLHYRTPLDKKPRISRTWWYHILRTSLKWLEDCYIDAWINVLRKSDMLRIQPINDSNTINEKPTNILRSTVSPLSDSVSH
uniref:DUF1985 domain-containing protein n=1 Tax=Brassica oleracea var. oleracea TaxID=109376 RepID=A0A0D3BFZ8_BRAOL